MFEIGWSEMLLCAIVALIVVGPKDLPHMMRAFGRWVAQLRGLAGQFQRTMEDAAREMDSEDLRSAKKGFSDLRSLRNPFDAAVRGVNDALNNAGKPPARAAEPSKAASAAPAATAAAEAAESPAPLPPAPAPIPTPSPTASAPAEAAGAADSDSLRR